MTLNADPDEQAKVKKDKIFLLYFTSFAEESLSTVMFSTTIHILVIEWKM